MALVTIGIPVYNEERYLKEAVESAIHQDFRDIDIVISDNGSTDRSAEIIRHYAGIDRRIRPIYLERNFGPTANFKSLLDNTDSKYFVVLGAHDLFLPDYIAKAVEFLETHQDYVMAYPRSKLVDGNDEQLRYRDSNIDTEGLSVRRRMLKTIHNLSWCTCFHGVFRTEIVRQLPTLKICGSDNLFLFATAYHGHIRFMEHLGIMRRESRQETPEMIEKRRVEAGNYPATRSRWYDHLSVMAMEHVMFVVERTKLPLLHRAYIALSVALTYRRLSEISLVSIFLAYIHRQRM